MTTTESSTPSTTLSGFAAQRAQMAEAAQDAQQQRRREIVEALGLDRRERALEVLDLGNGDAVVEVVLSMGTMWAAVVDNKRPREYHPSRDAALVHLVAQRHDGVTTRAHEYALRVLNVPSAS